jgi:tripartite ATP-independent transporter DctM subunit
MEFLLRMGGRLANRYVLLVVLLVLLGAGFAHVAGLNAEQKEELLYQVQRFLPILMFLTLGVLLFSGYPVAFILGGLALIFGVIGFFLGSFRLVQFFNFVPRIWGQAAENLVLVAIPTFIFMGVMMERSGIAQDLLYCVQVLLKRVPGALALGVTIMGTILAAMTGIIGASVTMMTALALPTMMKQGYSHALACGTIAAAGTLGILIPPSINFILYGLITSTSVPRLYLAGMIPGLLLTSFFMLIVLIYCLADPRKGGEPLETNWADRLASLKDLAAPLFIFFVVVGSIYLGWATPTEAASMGVFAALILAAWERALSWKMLRAVFEGTMRTTAMIMLIIIAAQFLNFVLATIGLTDGIGNLIEGLHLGK